MLIAWVTGAIVHRVWPNLNFEVTENSSVVMSTSAKMAKDKQSMSYSDDQVHIVLTHSSSMNLEEHKMHVEDNANGINLTSIMRQSEHFINVEVGTENSTMLFKRDTFDRSNAKEKSHEVDGFQFSFNNGNSLSSLIQTRDLR